MIYDGAKPTTPASYWDGIYEKQSRPRQVRYRKWDLPLHAELADHIGELSQSESTTFLEVGCAPAQFMVYYNQVLGWDVAGIELSEIGITRSKAMLEANCVAARLYAGDVLTMEPEDQYDVVGSFGLVEHFVDPLPCYRAMMRWIRPGGAMIVSVPNLIGPIGWAYRIRDCKKYLEHRRFSAEDLAKHCRAVGLRVAFHGLVGNLYAPYLFKNKSKVYRLPNLPARVVNGLVRRAAAAFGRPIKLGSLTQYVGCVAFKDE